MKILLSILFILISVFSAFGQRTECFPFERLPPEKRKKAEDLLLKALDSEALYTIVGGLKPMSSGFASFQFTIREPRGVIESEAVELLQNIRPKNPAKICPMPKNEK
ncbi:MAG: hypothetical protein HC846_02550 [Blastocatellia bacterium]|nr:hypothetical protein [Blastocatellia bacterium]